jgi:hypothetical protein
MNVTLFGETCAMGSLTVTELLGRGQTVTAYGLMTTSGQFLRALDRAFSYVRRPEALSGPTTPSRTPM